MRFTNRKTHFTDRIPHLSTRSIRTDRQTVYNQSCYENISCPTNEMRFTDRRTLFTDRIPLLSIRSIRMDRQTVYNCSCHENILSPTYEMRLTNRKTLFTDRTPLLTIRSIRTDRQTVYNSSCHENILSPTYDMRLTNRKTHFTDRVPPVVDPFDPYGSTHGLYGPLRCGCIGQCLCLSKNRYLTVSSNTRRIKQIIRRDFFSHIKSLLYVVLQFSWLLNNVVHSPLKLHFSICTCYILIWSLARFYVHLWNWKQDQVVLWFSQHRSDKSSNHLLV